MAEQIPFSIVENLLMKLGSSIFREIGLMYGVGSELGKLEEKLSTIKAVLADAEEQQQRSPSHAVANWVQRLQDVVYDADDLFDDFEADEMRGNTDVKGRFAGQVSDFFSSSNHLAFRSKMGQRIKAIRERLDNIGNDISKFNFIPRVVISDDVPVKNRGRETCSVVDKSHKIVGRDEDEKHIVGLLMQSSNLSIIIVAIVGMGGLGKTTLAQLAYNNERVANYFDLKMWVCVSDDFDVKTLVRNVIMSATNKGVEDLKLDQLQKLLGENLDGKRYLLVLDDVWNENDKKWDQFIGLLPVGVNGSRVLVTTRSTKVASVMKIDSPYIVEGLKDDESWELFESLAFKKGEEKMHPNLVAIGKEIVKMCKGVPLVIETVGRMLYFKCTQESKWLNIKNNRSLMLLGDENDILPVLRLSYDNLPNHLKQCFAYCALFPKDYKMERRDLVQLWVAQGYVQPSLEHECLEDAGDEYCKDLLTRSLFQEVEVIDIYGDAILYYKMHDLIHDLAQSVVKSDIIMLTDGARSSIPKRVHHVSLFRATNEVPKDLMDKSIRTFFMGCRSHGDHITDGFISSLKCSRVMKMSFGRQKLPTSLGKLSHLRYLDLSYGSFEKLPSAVTRLRHLQTLKLFNCGILKQWPRKMKKLINLRHLEIDECNRLRYMPCGLGELTQLQTLPLFLAAENEGGWHKGKRMGGGLSELKSLNNLRGQLEIRFREDREAAKYYKELAILQDKQYLESLRLHCTKSEEIEEEEEKAVQVVSVMESLRPHQNLKELRVESYRGVRFPNWMMNDGLDLDLLLPNLVRIEIWMCDRCQVLPPFGQLPSLQHLELRKLNAVECMKDYHPLSAKPFFPSLKRLVIFSMLRSSSNGWGKRSDVAAQQPPSYPYLEELDLKYITPGLCSQLIICASSSLKSLKISNVSDLISLPPLGLQHLSTLQTLSISYCENLASLPDSIGCLTSLTRLNIIFCYALTSLPERIRSLRNLHTLQIRHCPYLSTRCQKGTGDDWPKISHIPNISIFGDIIDDM